MKRRDFIKTATGSSLLIPSILLGCQKQNNLQTVSANSDAMDEALQMMSGIAPLGNHAPMAVESLITLGHPEKTTKFIESYKRRFSAVQPKKIEPITDKNWKEALGDGKRNADWNLFFDDQFKETEWTEIVEKWTNILAPGLCAAAGHGVIRTCHAVRSLSRQKTELRLSELAEGLGYLASYFQPLPEADNTKIVRLKPAQAIKNIPLLPTEKRLGGSIMNQLKGLDNFPEFAETINLIATNGTAEQLLSELTETFATIYLENVSDRNNLTLLHAVTAISGLRSILPYLSPATTQKTLIYGWQTAAGLYSIGVTGETNKFSVDKEINKEDLIARAVNSNEEHAIKFTESCLREYALNPKPIYLQAANEGLGRLPNFV